MKPLPIFCLWIVMALGVFAQSSPSPGLICTATDGERKVVFAVPTPNFTLQAVQSIHPQLKPESSAEWNGVLKIDRAGRYCLRGDARIFLNGKEAQGRTNQLEAGEVPLHIEWKRQAGGARSQLTWESEFFQYEPIPASAFGHREEPPEVASSGEVARGRELVEDFNCLACHRSSHSFFQSRRAPDLTGIGSRVSPRWIFKWLENPRHFQAAAMMPTLLKNEHNRADMAAFLSGLTLETPLSKIQASTNEAAAGKVLFANIGCAACHNETVNPLVGLGSKMSVSQLAHYLRNPLAIDPSGRMPDLALKPNEPMQLASFLVESRNQEFEAPVPAGDPNRGKMFFGIIGCANCHSLRVDGKEIVPRFVATPLEQLQPERGCLGQDPPEMTPRYNFTAEERQSLNAFLRSPYISAAPVQDFRRTLNQFSCTACHQFNGPAKVTFQANQSPPPLTDAGNKLRRSWIDLVLNQQKRARPWLKLRMPHFGTNTLHPLLDGFAAQAGADLGEGPPIATTTVEQVSEGIRLMGKDPGGLACISCHDYRNQPAGAEMRGPELTAIFDRVRADWLRRWLHDPARIVPGTAMPLFFSGMPEPQANHKITQLVYALSAGTNMPVPAGLNEDARTYLLLVEKEPMMLRCFLPDASTRAIAVGLPERVSYCFDAESCRFRYAWSGDFLDARATWRDRGGLPPQILGAKFYTAPDPFPLRLGESTHEAKTKFLGYRLTSKVPEFSYEVDGVVVRERIMVDKTRSALLRSFEIASTALPVWFNEENGISISSSSKPVGPSINGWRKIPPGEPTRFEVLIPIKNFSALKQGKELKVQDKATKAVSYE